MEQISLETHLLCASVSPSVKHDQFSPCDMSDAGVTDGHSWAAAQLPRPYPHLWQGEGSACLAVLAQAGLRHSWLPAVTPAQSTQAPCSSKHREEQWGRAVSQASGDMLADNHSSREEIKPGASSPPHPTGCL